MSEIKNPLLQVRVEERFLEAIDQAATKYGLDRSKFVKLWVGIGLLTDPNMPKLAMELSPNKNIGFAEIMSCIAARRIAEVMAQNEVYGESEIEELCFDENGNMCEFNELFNVLKSNFIDKFERTSMFKALEKESRSPFRSRWSLWTYLQRLNLGLTIKNLHSSIWGNRPNISDKAFFIKVHLEMKGHRHSL